METSAEGTSYILPPEAILSIVLYARNGDIVDRITLSSMVLVSKAFNKVMRDNFCAIVECYLTRRVRSGVTYYVMPWLH
jgi:hypothetical protein